MAPLLPCPFCGREAEVERHGTGRQSCIVACTWCGCRLESNEAGAGHSWNERASMQGLVWPGSSEMADQVDTRSGVLPPRQRTLELLHVAGALIDCALAAGLADPAVLRLASRMASPRKLVSEIAAALEKEGG